MAERLYALLPQIIICDQKKFQLSEAAPTIVEAFRAIDFPFAQQNREREDWNGRSEHVVGGQGK